MDPTGRRMTPGRPVTFVVTQNFLDHFGLKAHVIYQIKTAFSRTVKPPTPVEPTPTEEDEDQTELFED